jgi:hypothetical protein
MIYETLQILKEQIETYFTEVGLEKIVILENIALWESGSSSASKLEDKVAMTLLKLEEEPTLKNVPNYKIKDNKTEYRNPPVHLNLFILVSANCDTYENRCAAFHGYSVFSGQENIYIGQHRL